MTVDPSLPRTLLIGVNGADADAIADLIGAGGASVGLTDPAALLGQLSQGDTLTGELRVLVLGPDLVNPLSLARQVHALAPRVHFVFGPEQEHYPTLKHELQHRPMIGNFWSLAAPNSGALLSLVREAFQAATRRAQLRSRLERANARIGTPSPIASHDYHRLIVSDQFLRNLLAQAQDAIISLDINWKVLFWSGGAERLFGLSAQVTLGQPADRLPCWNESLAAYLNQMRSHPGSISAELAITTPSGPGQAETLISGIREDSGSLIGFSLFMRDVTARNSALRAADEARAEVQSLVSENEQQRRRFESMLSTTADQNYVTDLEGRILYGNRALFEQLELPAEKVLGKSASEFGFGPDEAGQIRRHMKDVVATGETVRAEVPFQAPSGRCWVFEYIFVPVFDVLGRVEAIAGTTRDITEHKQASERIWREANYDALTGLPNRRLFRDRLDYEVKHAGRNDRPFALFFVDLDRFKQINDLHGHAAGDELLRQAAARISHCVRKSDTVARLGGDEFTVVLSELPSDQAHIEGTAQKILDGLARPFRINGAACYISGSIGITLWPRDALTAEDLIRNADQAMYLAKHNGRSRFAFFTRSLQEAALNRLRLLADLRHAAAEQQMRLYFQPIVSLKTGRIVKAEALLRWQHPERGLLLPAEFISLAEESSLIKSLGNWVFTQAADYSQRWSRLLGKTLQISINKSAVQFEDPGRHMDWAALLKTKGLPKNSISVEITESVLLNAGATTADKLLQLQGAGIQLAIDDFGTGYSSMAYLKRLDVDYLKIDQSFIHDMHTSESSRAIAESIIAMGHKLGLKVIAEGVETAGQRDWLLAAGCDYAQGFLFSRPLEPELFERLLRQSECLSPSA